MDTKFTTIVSYKTPTKGGRAVAKALSLKLRAFRDVNWALADKPGMTYINWGSINVPAMTFARVVNRADVLVDVVDKTQFFTKMASSAGKPRIPEWTTDKAVAVGWAKAGEQVLARTLSRASGGRGIIFYGDGDLTEFLMAGLFTKYIKKKSEWRVHYAFGKQIDVQKKGLRHDADRDAVDFRIQTHTNGFIFLRDNIIPPEDVLRQSRLAYEASGLDFGAVDCVYNESRDQAYVLEINTAPGLEGTTVDNYAAAFKDAL